MAQPTTSTHSMVPASVREEMARNTMADPPVPKDCWRTRPLRMQLLVSYGLLSLLTARCSSCRPSW